MSEIPQPIEITKYKAPSIEGSLALAGGSPPNEPPSFSRRKRHLALVAPLTDSPSDESVVATIMPQLVDEVAQRRKLKQTQEQPVPLTLSQQEIGLESLWYEQYRPSPFIEQPVAVKQDVFVAKKKEEKRTDSEFFYSKEWVQAEVEKVKQEPVKSGERPWWHLDKTGFWVREQIRQLVRNLKGVGKEAFPNVLELELSKVAEDFRHFEMEYLKQMATLTWNLDLQERDGQIRVICPDYKGAGENANGSLWSSVTSKDERDGVVFETLFGNKEKGTIGVEGEIQKAHKEAKQGKGKKKMWVIESLAGWSGYDGITYPEAQIYAIQMQEDGSLKAHTFRIDATMEQGEDLQRKLGLTVARATNSKQRIKNALANVATLTPEGADQAESEGRRGIRTFEDLVDVIQEAVGGRAVAYGEGGGVKTFSEIKTFIKHPELFNGRHEMTDKLIERFSDYARWRVRQGGNMEDMTTDLEIAMALNPLQLNQAYKMEAKRPMSVYSSSGGFDSGGADRSRDVESALIRQAFLNPHTDYNKAKNDLEELPGCAGGGSKSKQQIDQRYDAQFVTTMGGSRVAIKGGKPEQMEGKENEEQEWFSCSECGWKASGPIGDAPCGGCGFTKEQYAEKYGLIC